MKVLVLLSGGLDSTVLLADLLRYGHDVDAVSFDYGQKHVKEVDAARRLCSASGVRFDLALMPSTRSSALTDAGKEIPEGSSFRQGLEYKVDGSSDLVVWVKKESNKPVEFKLISGNSRP